MSSDDSGSVTHWLGALRGGELDAAQPLWERYFARLVRLAQARLRTNRRPGAAEDEEDAALSAFDSFCRAATAGPLPPARRPRRSLAAPGRHHRTQGHGPGAPRTAAEARWRPSPHRGRPEPRRTRRRAGRARRDRRPRAHPRVRRGVRRGVSSPLRGLARRGRCGGSPSGNWRGTPSTRSLRSSAVPGGRWPGGWN